MKMMRSIHLTQIKRHFKRASENMRNKNGTINCGLSGENLGLLHARNKGTDQPAHPRSLISAFLIRLLDICCMHDFNI